VTKLVTLLALCSAV